MLEIPRHLAPCGDPLCEQAWQFYHHHSVPSRLADDYQALQDLHHAITSWEMTLAQAGVALPRINPTPPRNST